MPGGNELNRKRPTKKSAMDREGAVDAIDLLNEQHDEVEALFKKAGKADGEEQQALFFQIADALAIHATIEEKIFYPAAKEAGIEDIILESLEEHLSAKRIIADLLELEPEDEQFAAKLTVLKEQILEHVDEEKDELFPKVKKALGKDQRQALGQQMAALATELEGTEPRNQIPDEIDAAPRL